MTIHTARDPRWLSTAEAAADLGITPRSLYQLLERGDLPVHRHGRLIRLRADDVDAYRQRRDDAADG